jgi:hypothetical protein
MATRRSDDNVYSLLSNAASTGAAVNIRGGQYAFAADGTAGGATIALQVQTPNGTWSTVSIFNNSPVSTITLPFDQTAIDLPAGNVRASINGGAGVSVTAFLVGLG